MRPTTSSEAEPGTPNSANRRSALLLIAMLIVLLDVPALFGRSRIPEPFDQSRVAQFDSAAPELVFIGNSLLDTRIDPDLLAELTGIPTLSMAINGTAPGTWYLQLTNVIAAAENPPDAVFVFFHDDLITRPISFTGPKDRKLIESLSHTESITLEGAEGTAILSSSKEGKRATTLSSRIKQALTTIYPITNQPTTSPVSSIGAQLTGLSPEQFEKDAENKFAFVNKRDQAPTIQQPKFHGSFASKIDDSFLPLIIQQAKELNANLVIVRVAARPNNDGTPNEPDSLAEYSSDLAIYLGENDVRYIDMIGHAEDGTLDAGMYYDGYHLKHRFRGNYTEFFAEWLLANEGTHP
jgi:hypothetical protein